ncbi:glycosyltransferase [Dermatobacter hominis]|uniref:glycosyltransferase n=1 Tax=Dermatobacter hominis TaxID=2884263 RepID=UPI001D126151|nr:glycosyltransferase [Dermatobacter hominis]UDY33928.1 glycosyltransferase [Dermatobacter hominis]
MARVLMLTTSPDRRGAEVFAVALAEALEPLGHRCTLLAVRPAAASNPLPIPAAGRSRWDPVGLSRLASAARRHDVVVGHGSATLLAGSLAARVARRPFVYRNIGDPAQWGEVPLAAARIGWPLRGAAAVTALYEGAREELIGRYRLDPRRVRVVPNAVDAAGLGATELDATELDATGLGDTGAATAAPAVGPLDPDLDRVGWLGALAEEKRPELAIRAVAGDPGLGLLVAGDGPLASEARRLATELAPDRVRFLGSVGRPRDLLDHVDVLVVPSRTEGLPAAAIEAGMVGLPVVGYAVGGMPEVVLDGVTGVLLDPRSADGPDAPAALAAALRDAVARGEELGVAARQRCLERFDLPVVAGLWSEVIDSVT